MRLRLIYLAWRYFCSSFRYLFLEGRWRPDQIHIQLIEAAISGLAPSTANVVRKQLQQPFWFSWMGDGRINIFFFYETDHIPLIADSDFDDRLYRVELFVDGKKHWANITFYRGRIFSIEMKKPRSYFRGKQLSVGKAELGKSKDTFTKVIDRAEHGSEFGE